MSVSRTVFTAAILIFTALPRATAAPAEAAPPEELKRQMSDQLSTAIADAERAVTQITVEETTAAVKSASALGSALKSAQQKWRALNDAAPAEFNRVREASQGALAALQNAVFETASHLKAERTVHSKRVRDGLSEVDRMLADLGARQSTAAAKSKTVYHDALTRIEANRARLATSVDKLAATSGKQWAEIRKDAEARLSEAREIYTDAIHRGDKPVE